MIMLLECILKNITTNQEYFQIKTDLTHDPFV